MKEWSRGHSCLELSVLTTASLCHHGTILQTFRNPTCGRSLSIFCKSHINIPDGGHNLKQTGLLCQFITRMNAAVMRLRALTWAHGSVIAKAQKQNWQLEKTCVCVCVFAIYPHSLSNVPSRWALSLLQIEIHLCIKGDGRSAKHTRTHLFWLCICFLGIRWD